MANVNTPLPRPRRRAGLLLGAALLLAAACSSTTTGNGGTNNAANGPASAGTGGSTPGSTAAPGASLAAAYPSDDTIKLNQIQVLGSHNSYHVRTPKALRDKVDQTLGSNVSSAWDYEHAPLDTQFGTEGIRQIEIDVHLDPDGRFAVRHAMPALGLSPDAPAEMKQPGLKVFHLPEIDFASNCTTFKACLMTVKTWSDANPGHVPIMILVEAKSETIPDVLKMGFATSIPFDKAGLDSIDTEIKAVFDAGSMITPDQVRGSHQTLEEAVLAGDWPTLRQSRGKVLFMLDNGDLRQQYADGHPSLQGRVMFSNAKPGEPEAAYVQQSAGTPEKAAGIPDLVKKGYVVRVLVDGDPKVAKAGDLAESQRAIDAGAQWVSTDYEVPDATINPDFQVKLPGGATARCNPVNAPPGCKATDIENKDALKA